LEVIPNLRWLAGEMGQPPRHCKQQGKNNAVVNNKEKTMPFQFGQSGGSKVERNRFRNPARPERFCFIIKDRRYCSGYAADAGSVG
jgi:hypothetical protein